MHLRRTPLAAIVLLAWALVAARPAAGDEPQSRAVCSDAYVRGQHLLRDRKLLDARELLILCARPPCSVAIQPECTGWLAEAERATPSVVLAVHDATGKDLVDVTAHIDGKLFAGLTGAAVEIDPGPHVLRVEAPGRRPVEQTIVVREGEKSRLLSVELEEAAAPAGGTRAAPSRLPAYILGGVGVIAAGTFAYFGVSGLVLRGQLASCRGHCAESSVNQGNSDWAGADVSLGVSLVSLGLGAYFYARGRPHAAPTASLPTPMVGFAPGGGVLGVEGKF
jgi:hypothetical protein